MSKKEVVEIDVRHDMRDFGFYQTHNFIVDDYIPLIGTVGFTIYSLLVRRAMHDKMNTKLAQGIIREHLGIQKATVPIYILTLELCGLIYVNRKHREVSEMFILQPKRLFDPETREINQTALAEIRERIINCQKYSSLKKSLLSKIDEFQSLFQRLDREEEKSTKYIKITNNSPDNTKQPDLFINTNNYVTTDMQGQTEFVAHLVERFKESKLSEDAAIKLIEQYGLEAVRQQLTWLSNRETDTPLRTLRAALKGKWTEPKSMPLKAESTFLNEPSPAPTHNPLTADWQQIKERIKTQLTQAAFDTWVKQTELVQVEGNQWVVACESNFAKDWLTERLNGTLAKVASQVAGQEVMLFYIVKDNS
jgi:hypothetical protein